MKGLEEYQRRAPRRVARMQEEWYRYVIAYSDVEDETVEVLYQAPLDVNDIRPDTPTRESSALPEDEYDYDQYEPLRSPVGVGNYIGAGICRRPGEIIMERQQTQPPTWCGTARHGLNIQHLTGSLACSTLLVKNVMDDIPKGFFAEKRFYLPSLTKNVHTTSTSSL